MTRVWFDTPLETVATFWRVLRRDGVTLGFTTHDRDLRFDYDHALPGHANGMTLSATELLSRIPHPTHDQIREALAGNLCRCTGYKPIVEAVYEASRENGKRKTGKRKSGRSS